MAKSRRKKYATAKRSNPGRRRHTKRVTHRRRTARRNPGTLGSPADWLMNGAGVAAGVIGARALPQMLLGASNTGTTGYIANAAAAIGLGFVAHMAFPRNRTLAAFVTAGGFAGLIARIAADKTPFGAQLSLSGLGDWGLGLYQKSNFPYPQRIQNGRLPSAGSSMFTWGDGTQGRLPSMANAGADSTGAC